MYLWLLIVSSLTYNDAATNIVLFDSYDKAHDICQLALSDAKQDGQCAEDINVIVVSDCSPTYKLNSSNFAIKTIALNDQKLNYVFIGPTCSEDVSTIATFSEIWKTPTISTGPIDPYFLSPSLKSVINVGMFSYGACLITLQRFMLELNQKSVTLVGSMSANSPHIHFASQLFNYNKRNPTINISKVVEFDESNVNWDDILDEAKSSSQLIVICANFKENYHVLHELGIRQLSTLRFIVGILLYNPPESSLYHESIKHLIYGANAFIIAPRFSQFTDTFNKMLEVVPDFEPIDFEKFLRIYNGCYAYCFGSSLGGTQGVSDYHSVIGSRTMTNKFGEFKFDSGGNILTDYGVFSVDPEADMKFETLLSLTVIPRGCDNYVCYDFSAQKTDDILWTFSEYSPPTDCLKAADCKSYLPHILASLAFFLVTIAVIIIVLFQRRKRNNVFKYAWKIPKDNLKIIVNKNADAKMQRELENRKKADSEKGSKEALLTRRRVFGTYALIGTTKAEFISFKQLKKLKFDEKSLTFLYNLKQVQHDNLTKMMGVGCNETDFTFYAVYALIERATLEDFLLDAEFAMDNMFKSAFMADLIRGLSYLHRSPIGYHGFLNSNNCLIDTNWVLKLTNFGISNMVVDFFEEGSLKNVEHAPPTVSYSQYSWYAPEHMIEYDSTGKLPPRILRGSRTGDIYSLGLIIWQMLFRSDPFISASPFERPTPTLFNDIMHNNLTPQMSYNGEEDALLKKVEECLRRDVTMRPSLKGIQEAIYKTYPSQTGNLIDQMMQMNIKYATNLEAIVQERSEMVRVAEQQTMRLLNEMLPASIAQILKEGGQVPPRSYDSATVMFVQICDFSVFMHESTPNQIVSFLNNVFEQFDVIIKCHDAYKVETTGETYMVASGVPTENGGNHIFEIAEISLKVREASYVYAVEHLKNFKLRLKIGFHAGPIAAGVIGIRSPRYCLFGDTVNFASRMQSNCPPNQIQTSEQTAKLLFETHQYKLVKRGIVHVKGKGEVNCYWLNEHMHDDNELPNNDPLTVQEPKK